MLQSDSSTPEKPPPTPDPNQPRLLALLFCDWANQTEDGKTNLSGIFDRLLAAKLPGPVEPVFLYARFANLSPGQIDIVVIAPDGTKTASISARWTGGPAVENVKGPIFVQLLTRVALRVKSAGIHWVDARFNGQSLGTAPLAIEEVQQEEHGDNPQPVEPAAQE